VRTAVIGPVTAERLRDFGLRSDILPASYRAESVVEAFAAESMAGHRVLLPRAETARPLLPEQLTAMGAEVDVVTAYRTEIETQSAEALLEALRRREVDLVTFTSSSTVQNFKQMLPPDEFDTLLQDVAVASIGPITSETAAKLGFTVHTTAETYTIDGLCEAITDYFMNPHGARRHNQT